MTQSNVVVKGRVTAGWAERAKGIHPHHVSLRCTPQSLHVLGVADGRSCQSAVCHPPTAREPGITYHTLPSPIKVPSLSCTNPHSNPPKPTPPSQHQRPSLVTHPAFWR